METSPKEKSFYHISDAQNSEMAAAIAEIFMKVYTSDELVKDELLAHISDVIARLTLQKGHNLLHCVNNMVAYYEDGEIVFTPAGEAVYERFKLLEELADAVDKTTLSSELVKKLEETAKF